MNELIGIAVFCLFIALAFCILYDSWLNPYPLLVNRRFLRILKRFIKKRKAKP